MTNVKLGALQHTLGLCCARNANLVWIKCSCGWSMCLGSRPSLERVLAAEKLHRTKP